LVARAKEKILLEISKEKGYFKNRWLSCVENSESLFLIDSKVTKIRNYGDYRKRNK